MSNPIWLKELSRYEGAIRHKAILQIINSVVPYVSLLGVMFYLEVNNYPYWLILLLSVLTSVFFVRIFIIQHDCGHYSFFNSRKANDITGTVCSYLTLIPYREFQHSHSLHHANSGKLEKRGVGDIWTMTVQEYMQAGKWVKRIYKTYRNPFIFLTFGPLILVLITSRLPSPSSRKAEIIAIMLMNLFILLSLTTAYFTIGIVSYVKVMAPVLFISESIGMWLFFVQHCYEDAYWASAKEWDPVKAALSGSSFYKLPKILQWATGNIGFHHIHHLRSRIPNYRLNDCFNAIEELRNIKPITIADSLKQTKYTLYDPDQGKVITFSEFKALIKEKPDSGITDQKHLKKISKKTFKHSG